MKIIENNREYDKTALKQVYLDTMLAMAKEDSRVYAVDADLRLSLGSTFVDNLPAQAVDCGIQEANMVGVCAGMSATGLIPFAHTFGPFMTRRVYDVIFLSAAYAKLNVKLMGSDPGVSAAFNGGTHMPFEDMGMMRMVPDAIVLDTADSVQFAQLLRQIKEIYGVQYVRFPRGAERMIYQEGSTFEIGKGATLRSGKAATVIASGIMVAEALDAADQLSAQGIDITVVDMFTIKPIDAELICKCAKETGAIVTAENHNIINGLGSAVAEVLVESDCCVPMERVGAKDVFGEVGPVDYLMERFSLKAADIIEAVKNVIARKEGK